MKKQISLTAAAGALLFAAPAFAHGGAHSDGFVAHLAHWMSSPVHGLYVIGGVIALGALAAFATRKKA